MEGWPALESPSLGHGKRVLVMLALPQHSIDQLSGGTPGSAGLDLSSAARAILTPQMGPQALPTGVYGPLPKGSVGLLLGRSSAYMKGIRILPGVIDNDYEGEIKIMAEATQGVSVIPQGERIAQLLLLPIVSTKTRSLCVARWKGGFGSTGTPQAFWVAHLDSRPKLELKIQGKSFVGILDTGADVSIISKEYWPARWPLEDSTAVLQGIGQTRPQKSACILKWSAQRGMKDIFNLMLY